MKRKPRVHNRKYGTAPPDAVFIGRPSKFGNKFVIGRDGSRAQVCEMEKQRILADPELQAMIKRELRGKDVECFCAPDQCHGDFLVELANSEDDDD